MNNRPDYRFHVFIRGIILIGFTMLMFKLITTGNITNFIAPRMMPFIYFAVVTFLILGVVQIWRSGSKNDEEVVCNCGFEHSEKNSPLQSLVIYSFFVFPIITGFMFPEVVLDSSIASKRGFKSGLVQQQQEPAEESDRLTDQDLADLYLSDPEEYMKQLEERVEGNASGNTDSDQPQSDVPLEHPEGFEIEAPPEGYYEKLEAEMLQSDKITLTEEQYIQMTNIIDKFPEKFAGKEMELIGFVYREPDFESNQFVVARFGLSCCVADASVYGTLAAMPDGEALEEDQWVRVSGVLEQTTYNDWNLPYLQINSIEKIEQPSEPYVYENY
ncbi:TIGR03943 family protein [Bacillus lacus]|uniref:TIGR03943 family protein n=1 Tax=Metabacillus lacus TaxID=1983721 RepID=A0A7X2IZ89_9BACI|nr:TIGR03943 family protein [Metabacillus lacus]MRX72401.1 TIGR03943 family protein [Metabacillus lacus]